MGTTEFGRTPPSWGCCYCGPDERQHVRELAHLTGVSPGTLHRELTALASLGVLRRNEVGRQVFFAANRDCTLEQSSQRWHEGKHDPWPYINFVLFFFKTAGNSPSGWAT